MLVQLRRRAICLRLSRIVISIVAVGKEPVMTEMGRRNDSDGK
jgi:hypothetical protein